MPMVMMAIVGTFAFNFQTVMPLLVKRTLHGTDRTFTLDLQRDQHRLAGWRAVSARRSSVNVRNIVWAAFGFGVSMLLLAVTPNVPFTYPIGILVGFSSIAFMTTSTAIVQIALRSVDARSGAGVAGDGVPRQHADRRTDSRLRVATLRPAQRCR